MHFELPMGSTMNPLRIKDIFLQPTDFHPTEPVEPSPISRDDNSPKLFTTNFTSDEFRVFWAKERVAFQWEYRSEAGFRNIARNTGSTLLPVYTLPRENGVGKRRAYDWSFRFQCRRHRPPKNLAIRRESIGTGCPVYIRMRKLVGEDKIQIEYLWQHNHDSSAQARAKLPAGYNELHWTKAKIAEGFNWKGIKDQLRPSPSSTQGTLQELDNPSQEDPTTPTSISYNHFRKVLYRQQTNESWKANDVPTSVRLWMEQIVQEGGKSVFEERIGDNPNNFMIAWSTSFQLQVMSDNSGATAYVDSNDKTVKSIRPSVTNNKTIEPAYLFTMLVKPISVQRGIPVGFMICGSESSDVFARWLSWLNMDCGFRALKLMVDCSTAEIEIMRREVPNVSKYYCSLHVGKAWEQKMRRLHPASDWDTMRPQLQQIRSAESAEKLVAAWTAFKDRFPTATDMLQYLEQWMTPDLAAKWAVYMREYQDPQHIEAINLAEAWHNTLKKHYLGNRRDVRADSLIFLLHGQVNSEFRDLYSKIQNG